MEDFQQPFIHRDVKSGSAFEVLHKRQSLRELICDCLIVVVAVALVIFAVRGGL